MSENEENILKQIFKAYDSIREQNLTINSFLMKPDFFEKFIKEPIINTIPSEYNPSIGTTVPEPLGMLYGIPVYITKNIEYEFMISVTYAGMPYLLAPEQIEPFFKEVRGGFTSTENS